MKRFISLIYFKSFISLIYSKVGQFKMILYDASTIQSMGDRGKAYQTIPSFFYWILPRKWGKLSPTWDTFLSPNKLNIPKMCLVHEKVICLDWSKTQDKHKYFSDFCWFPNLRGRGGGLFGTKSQLLPKKENMAPLKTIAKFSFHTFADYLPLFIRTRSVTSVNFFCLSKMLLHRQVLCNKLFLHKMGFVQ